MTYNSSPEPAVNLLPEYEDPSSQQEVLEGFWPVLFEAMLEGWVTDESLWPRNWTLEMFPEWLEAQIRSLVQDLHRARRSSTSNREDPSR